MRLLFSKTFFFFLFSFFILSCSVSKKISQQADKILLQDPVINTGTIGISIYEPSTNKYWYNYNATKNFVPASNTKLFTLYAGMKYLGDSLVGIRYQEAGPTLILYPTADPTFLHEKYSYQPVVKFLQKSRASSMTLELNQKDNFKKYPNGWAWEDFSESYMTERSRFPFYGNTIKVTVHSDMSLTTLPVFNHSPAAVMLTEKEHDFRGKANIFRETGNMVYINKDKIKPGTYYVPFTNYSYSIPNHIEGLIPYQDTIHHSIDIDDQAVKNTSFHSKLDSIIPVQIIHSQPSDSLFKPMMHNSDNFFAEQTLLMTSNEKLGYMNDQDIIDTLLKNDLKDIPQKPRWVDGSGLSRYNLFTPKSFVYILNKMKNEFGFERLKEILPTGGEGTLKNYYLADSLSIYAKTGTMSNQNALSGFLITKQNKLLIFSVLANSFQGKTAEVRRKVEQFVEYIRNKY